MIAGDVGQGGAGEDGQVGEAVGEVGADEGGTASGDEDGIQAGLVVSPGGGEGGPDVVGDALEDGFDEVGDFVRLAADGEGGGPDGAVGLVEVELVIEPGLDGGGGQFVEAAEGGGGGAGGGFDVLAFFGDDEVGGVGSDVDDADPPVGHVRGGDFAGLVEDDAEEGPKGLDGDQHVSDGDGAGGAAGAVDEMISEELGAEGFAVWLVPLDGEAGDNLNGAGDAQFAEGGQGEGEGAVGFGAAAVAGGPVDAGLAEGEIADEAFAFREAEVDVARRQIVAEEVAGVADVFGDADDTGEVDGLFGLDIG